MNEMKVWADSQPERAEPEPSGEPFPNPPDPGPNTWYATAAQIRIVEQRACQRYPAIGGRSWLGWYVGSQFEQTAAWILNLSASGCLTVADRPVPADRSLWLRLDDPAVPDWAEVRVVGHHTGNGGMLALRLVFRGACPYELMKAVAFGPTQNRPTQPEPSRSWSFNSW
jgi:hypothetical protein